MNLSQFERYARALSRRFPLWGAGGDEQDVQQEAMIAAWQAMLAYRPGNVELVAFVKRRMKLRVLDYVRLRDQHGQRRMERDTWPLEEWDAQGGDVTLATVLDRERLAQAAEAIRCLPRWQRDRLHGHLNGVKRAGMREGAAVNGVDQALYRARRRVAQAVA